MTKHLPILSALLFAGAGLGACSDRHSSLDLQPGRYETSTKSTRPNGTDVEQKDSTIVGYDSYGNKRAVMQSTTTRDPPGLLNKSTTRKTTVEER